uniref:Sex comb on midleg-like protein 2 n=1 Tax=Aceria tosichella TaxID=561515 RepID=A0A6G1SHU5_9ACAR
MLCSLSVLIITISVAHLTRLVAKTAQQQQQQTQQTQLQDTWQQQQQLQQQQPQQNGNGNVNGNISGNVIGNDIIRNDNIASANQNPFAPSTDTNHKTGHESTREIPEEISTPYTPSPMPPPSPVATPSPMRPPGQAHSATSHKETYYSYKASPAASTFSWDTYLKLRPAPVAPKEAFRQPAVLPKNHFEVGMKLEAKDPRNSSNWCLATVIFVEGLHLRLRFVGADKMNDLYELIDSENIRAVGAKPSDLLLAPTGFTHNIAQYPKFVEKVLRDETTIIAPPEYFPPTPPKPEKNLFERGMKLEAVDLKNRDFICPATIGAVEGNKLLIVFDGWKGSFDYRCEYFSRDIFPINWCRDVGRAIQPPNGWEAILKGGVLPTWSPPTVVTPDFRSRRATSTFNGFNKRRDNEEMTHSQTPTKKTRGRPRKNSNNSQEIRIPKEKPRPSSRPMSSTPKKKPATHDQTQESFMPSSPQANDGFFTRTDLFEDGSNINRFQCQRTVSYDEWQKKKHADQMPRQSLPDEVKDVGDNSLNLSDTTSMASTLSSSNRRDSTELSEQGGSSLKRPKVDTKNVSISDELRQLLDTKPSKLSQWTVDDVTDILGTESSLIKYIPTFQENEIDGKAFGLFDEKKRDLLMSMGLKLGPVLKVLNLREQVAFHVDTSDIVLR